MSERDECTSVPTASTVFTDFSCLCYYRGTVATDVTKGGKAAGKREITFSFIYKQHSWLKRTMCNFGVERSLTGISNLYARYEREPHCLLVFNHASVH